MPSSNGGVQPFVKSSVSFPNRIAPFCKSSMESPRPQQIPSSGIPSGESEEEFLDNLEKQLPSVDDLLDTLSAAADRSVLAAEAATEAERLAAIAAEEAAEAYLAASAAVGTEAFAKLKDIAEAAEKNTEDLTSAAAAAYKAYFLAYAQSMDASAAVERAELDAAIPDPSSLILLHSHRQQQEQIQEIDLGPVASVPEQEHQPNKVN